MTTKIKNKIDCCGSNFETEKVSIFGLLTFSMPMIIFFSLLYPFLFFLSFIKVFKKISKNLKIIIKANVSLIEKQDVFPRLRCDATAIISKLSINLSRKLYDSFNLLILSFVWFVSFMGVYLVL